MRHSLSPVLHAAAYAALGLGDWAYTAVECDEAGLRGFVEGLDGTWAGLSLTMPLKRVALEVADTVSDLAAAVGAANTLLLDGRRHAENTDVAGIVAALRSTGGSRVDSAVVLGAGGTAQAALAALMELGCTEPTVLVRNPARTGDLRAAAERLGVRPAVGVLPGADLPEADVVISTLPAGAADGLRVRGGTVLDVIYAPWPDAVRGGGRGGRLPDGRRAGDAAAPGGGAGGADDGSARAGRRDAVGARGGGWCAVMTTVIL